MNISEQLTCLFSAKIEAHGREDSYVVEIPKHEIEVGYVDPTAAHQLALLSMPANQETTDPPAESNPEIDHDGPPVTEGETRVVEIEEIGDQGDGLTRVDRGYVVIVPEAEKGERVEIEIETVRENVAFGRIVKRIDYYD